jgi:hypothetical protein
MKMNSEALDNLVKTKVLPRDTMESLSHRTMGGSACGTASGVE